MAAADARALDDEGIRLLVERLSRPHRSGGRVIERATILAEGLCSTAVLEWLGDHDWTPEADVPKAKPRSGLYGTRDDGRHNKMPRRYVSPTPGAASSSVRVADDGAAGLNR